MKWTVSDCSPGDMIRIRVGAIYHYGVFCSEDEVIEFGDAPLEGLNRDATKIFVKSVSIDEFAAGKQVEVANLTFFERRRRISPKKTVKIARSRIGEGGYDILKNNCEHFANECVFGKHLCSMEEEARVKWRERPVLDIYVADLSEELPAFPGFPTGRIQRRIKKAGTETQGQEEFLWTLLAYAAQKSFAYEPDEWKLKRDGDGSVCTDRFFFSFSVAGNTAAVAVSHRPVLIFAKEIPAEGKNKFYDRTEHEVLSQYKDHYPEENYDLTSGICEAGTPVYLAAVGESARMTLVWHYAKASGRVLKKLLPAEEILSL